MFRPSIVRPAVSVARRNFSLPTFLYKNIWEKSTAKYISYVLVTLVAVEYGYGKLFDFMWGMNNKGKLYKDIDWSKFETEE